MRSSKYKDIIRSLELSLEITLEMMARQEIQNRNIRKLTRTGRGASVSITLPIEFIRELGWKDRQKVVVEKAGKTLVIKDWVKK